MKKRLALLPDWIGDDIHPMLSDARYLIPKALALLPRCNEQLYYLPEIWFLQQQKGYAKIQLKKRQACYKVTEIDTKTENGWAPRHVAASKEQTALVQLLIDKGANVNAPITDGPNKGVTPLQWAAKEGELDTIEARLEHAKTLGLETLEKVLITKNKDGDTPLHVAAKEGELDTVETLLEHAKTLDPEALEKMLIAEDKNGDTPLHIAAQKGHLSILETLINAGADKDTEARDGWRPLHLAAQEGHLSILETLINAGADIDAPLPSAHTPLHIAADHGELQILERLLQKGANKEAQTKKGSTPLHLAVKNGNPETVKALLTAGAQVDVPAADGYTPLHIAAQEGHLSILEILINAGADKDTEAKDGCRPLHLAAQEGQTAIAQLLIDNGADVNAANVNGSTPLLLAVKNGKPETVKALLNARAKVDVTDANGDTPLHIAAQKGHLSILETLINVGADTTTKNNIGDIPYRMTTDKEVKKILRKKMSARLGEKLWLQLVRLDNPKGVDGGISLNYLDQEKQRIEALSKDSSLDGAIKEVYTTFLSAVEKLDNDTLPTSLGDNQKVFCPVSVGNHTIGIEVVKVDDTYKVTLFNRGDISNKYHDRDRHEGKQRVGASYVLDQEQYDDFRLMEKGAASVDDLYTFLVKRGNKEDPQKTPFMRPQTTGSCSTIWIDSYLKYLCYKKCEDKTEADKLYLGIRIHELEDTIRSIDDKIRFIDDQIEERQDVDLCKFLKSQKEYAQAKCDRRKTKLSQLKKPEEKPLLATKMGEIEVVNALLEAVTNVNTTDNKGTPLHWAVLKGQADIVKALLKTGADLNLKDNKGHTPIWQPKQGG